MERVLRSRGRTTLALTGVDLTAEHGEALALVGRSGSGKSTLVGVLAALDRPDAGQVLVGGLDPWTLPARARRAVRRRVGLVFQDALASFDPRWSVGQVVAEALLAPAPARVPELLERVGLDAHLAERRPATLSGGQNQRVALARALAADPQVLLADEPTSGLDVLAQERFVELLADARERHGLTVVLVTHDLRLARRTADRVVVLDHGRVAEDLDVTDLEHARHPATRELLDAVAGPPRPSSA